MTTDKEIFPDNSVEIEVVDNTPKLVDQPKPKFTLEDLEAKVTFIYGRILALQKKFPITTVDGENYMKTALGELQELMSIIAKHRNDLEPIDINKPEVALVLEALGTQKVEFYCAGVQLIEKGVLQGTSLYTTVVKARKIKDQLNREFARLRVNHEAKIVNYPVY